MAAQIGSCHLAPGPCDAEDRGFETFIRFTKGLETGLSCGAYARCGVTLPNRGRSSRFSPKVSVVLTALAPAPRQVPRHLELFASGNATPESACAGSRDLDTHLEGTRALDLLHGKPRRRSAGFLPVPVDRSRRIRKPWAAPRGESEHSRPRSTASAAFASTFRVSRKVAGKDRFGHRKIRTWRPN